MKNRLLALLAASPLLAQAQNESIMYSEGKIYVVIAVIGIIFLGIAGYLVRIDRKLTRLENEK